MEVIACRVIFKNRQITICNVYFNKDTIINKERLDELKALPPPLLILGDINAKHPAWGSDILDSRGALINDWIMDNDQFILNDGSPTRYDIHKDIWMLL